MLITSAGLEISNKMANAMRSCAVWLNQVALLEMVYMVCLQLCYVIGETTVQVSAPVNPAKEGGIISIRCQIWDLQPKYKVTMVGPDDVMTFGEEVMEKDNDRVFLAVKTMQDGSTVHFLSIINVAKSDAGVYSCKVINIDFVEVAQDSLNISIWYHPAETSPTCTPTESFRVTSGVPRILNCSSEDANPPVIIEWTKSGNRPVFGAVQRSHQGVVTSELTIMPTPHDDDTVYLCHVISPVFPDFKLTCYVGPMMVDVRDQHDNRNGDDENMVFDMSDTSNTTSGSDVPLRPPAVETKCNSSCSRHSASMRYWILATIASVLIALLLIMLNLVLFIRLHQIRLSREESDGDDPSRTLQRIADDICVDIGDGSANTLRSMDFNRVYMTLEGPKKQSTRLAAIQDDDLGLASDGACRHYMATFLGNTQHEPIA